MRLAMAESLKSPPQPTNFRVGAVLVDAERDAVLATGYSLELPGNTHAEQCCFEKLAAAHGVAWDRLAGVLPARAVLYTTMEPCWKRVSGNLPCVDRILRIRAHAAALARVYVGIQEPETFVGVNHGRQKLEEAGVEVVAVAGFEDEIRAIATTGHDAHASRSASTFRSPGRSASASEL